MAVIENSGNFLSKVGLRVAAVVVVVAADVAVAVALYGSVNNLFKVSSVATKEATNTF